MIGAISLQIILSDRKTLKLFFELLKILPLRKFRIIITDLLFTRL